MRVLAHSIVPALAVLAGAPVIGQWSTETLSGTDRACIGATTVGTKAIFAGGRSFHPVSGQIIRPDVSIYDDATGTWQTTSLSVARFGIAATSVGSKALFGGGTCNCGAGTQLTLDIYDDSTGTWSADALPTAAGASVATTVGTTALFTNGTTVALYDDSTGSWSTHWLLEPRIYLCGTSVGAKALFAGGRNILGEMDFVNVYDDTTGTWSAATLSAPRYWLAATNVGTKAHFAGGRDAMGNLSAVVDVYDDATGAWTVAALSSPRHSLAATRVGSKVFFVGGRVGTYATSAAVDIYDGATSTWSTATLSGPRAELAATTVGTKTLFAGGRDLWSSDIVDVYDDAIGTTYCGPAIPNSTGSPATIVSQGFPGSVSQGYAILTANDVPPGEFGYFLTSMTPSFPFMPPGSSGHLCLGGNIGRHYASVDQGPSFSLQIDLTAVPVHPPVAVQPGDTWGFQAWYRDSGHTNNFTDAVSVTFN